MKIGLHGRSMLMAAIALLWLTPAQAADHRDAPVIDDYSAVDINDVYMFRNPPDCTLSSPSCNLVVVLSTQAIAAPKFATTYHFQSNAIYRFVFAKNKAARPTATIDFAFSPFENRPECPAPQPACQTYTATFPGNIVINGFATQGTNSMTHLPPIITTSNGVKIFAGPRQDPFFFDLVGFNRSIASGTNQFTGDDAFEAKNINAIVLEFPVGMVFADKCVGGFTTDQNGLPTAFKTPCSVYAQTFLGDFRQDPTAQIQYTQVDRMGNPAVNTALIPAALKDAFNFGQPVNDPTDFANVILNMILTLDKRFGTCPQSATSASQCNPNVPFLASVAVPDTLKFALNVPDGFPNGRRPQDRTTDVLISLILQIPGFTDGTATKTACSAYPYLRPPLQVGGPPQTCD